MRIRDRLGVSERTQIRFTRGMQFCLVLLAGWALYKGNIGTLVNSLVSLFVTTLPALIERDYEVPVDSGLALWITTAVFLHAVGTLGPYRTVWWWDHMTHTLSSSVVAAAGYIAVRAIDEHYEEIYLPEKILFIFILVFVMAFGVIWEVLEFGIGIFSEMFGTGRILTQFGLEDTLKDLVFDSLGAIVVALFGEAYTIDIRKELENILSRRYS